MTLTQLELDCIRSFRDETEPPPEHGTPGLVLRLLLEACRMLRHARCMERDPGLKADGSASVEIERRVESELRAYIAKALPDAAFVGEESGGAFSGSGLVVAVDPVDGTWAFINGTETFATTITVFEDGTAVTAGIGNPATGELAYAARDGGARLVQVSAFGEADAAVSLPLATENVLLLNIHPSRAADAVLRAAHQAWDAGEVRMVRSPGGSPAWALVEAAKGHFVYVNLWAQRRAEPFDLAGPVLLVREAGGTVIDVHGEPIPETGHQGPFVAAIDASDAASARALVRKAAPPA